MSQFLSSLTVTLVDELAADGRGIWMVSIPFSYQSDILKKTVTVEVGFTTDFASVPRIPGVFDAFGDRAHKAAVLHDWLYHHHEVCDKDTADSVLKEAMLVSGIAEDIAEAFYLGVQAFGESSYEQDAKPT